MSLLLIMKSKVSINSILAAIRTITPFSQTHIINHCDKKRKNFLFFKSIVNQRLHARGLPETTEKRKREDFAVTFLLAQFINIGEIRRSMFPNLFPGRNRCSRETSRRFSRGDYENSGSTTLDAGSDPT